MVYSLSVKSIEPYTKIIGYPYKWCQIICGLYYINESDIKHKDVSKDGAKEKDTEADDKVNNLDEMEEDEDEIDRETCDIFT